MTPRVIIIGGGFGGLYAARARARDDVELLVLDRTNHHLFQPLLYQVATAMLAATDITAPIRWLLRGQKHLVTDAGCVDALVVEARGPDGVGLFLVERHGDRPGISVLDTVDATRRLARVSFDDDEGRLLAGPPEAAEVIARTRRRALAALAAEAVGIASHALALGVEHAKSREQFGRPIGAYQAVSHKLADTYVEVELARSLAYWAAWCIAEGDGQADLAATAAKSHAAETAVAACERAIQVHGGMGFTWDHPLHRYYKRALWIESFDRSGAGHRAEIAHALLDG